MRYPPIVHQVRNDAVFGAAPGRLRECEAAGAHCVPRPRGPGKFVLAPLCCAAREWGPSIALHRVAFLETCRPKRFGEVHASRVC